MHNIYAVVKINVNHPPFAAIKDYWHSYYSAVKINIWFLGISLHTGSSLV